ncbi:MAG TPA: hypothetical protein VGF76_10310, partial [Polyangiaceae bacterium]
NDPRHTPRRGFAVLGSLLSCRVRQSVLRLTFLLVLFGAVFLAPRRAQAYPWMIRHDYTGCATCHVDPSGGGVLTEYGAAQGDILLRTRYGASAADPDETSAAGFLWGAVKPPDWFLPSGSLRTLALVDKVGSAGFGSQLILMQADVRAAIVKGGFRAYGSLGFVNVDGSAASVSGGLVSREYWAGWSFAQDSLLLRAGRIDLPFGIRQIEHVFYVRTSSRTDVNDTQQHGVSLAYSGGLLRGEVMAIAGNYQISPDVYRERGYSAYAEIAPLSNAAFGLSSLVTHAQRDIQILVPNTRQAHGAFARWAPLRPLALLAEADFIAQSGNSSSGYATMLQADVEPTQGVHLIATGENMKEGGTVAGTSWSGWLGAGWFFAPHADVRFDFNKQSYAVGNGHLSKTALMLQFHVYL